MLQTLPPVPAIVRTDGAPRQYPVWTVCDAMFYSADEAVTAAQVAADECNVAIRVFVRLTRASERDDWQLVTPVTPKLKAVTPKAKVQKTVAKSAEPPVATIKPAIIEPLNESDARNHLLVGLLKLHPYCCGCGKGLVAIENRPNTATLVVERLSCPGCAEAIRETVIAECTLENNNRAWASKQKRYILRSALIQISPYCAHCGREVVIGGTGPDQAHLVRDRLSCPEHVDIVRHAAKDAKAERNEERYQIKEHGYKPVPLNRAK